MENNSPTQLESLTDKTVTGMASFLQQHKDQLFDQLLVLDHSKKNQNPGVDFALAPVSLQEALYSAAGMSPESVTNVQETSQYTILAYKVLDSNKITRIVFGQRSQQSSQALGFVEGVIDRDQLSIHRWGHVLFDARFGEKQPEPAKVQAIFTLEHVKSFIQPALKKFAEFKKNALSQSTPQPSDLDTNPQPLIVFETGRMYVTNKSTLIVEGMYHKLGQSKNFRVEIDSSGTIVDISPQASLFHLADDGTIPA